MNIRRIVQTPTRLKNLLKMKIFHVQIGKKANIKGKIHVTRFGNISIGNNCNINGGNRFNPIGCGNGCNIVAERTGIIVIGDDFGMSNSTVYSRISITIGNHVLLGGDVKIYDTDFHSLDAKYRGKQEDKQHTLCAPVVIENGVFIGAGSFILKGVHIGENAVIGAGSVVTKSVPAGEIWAGNPARFIRNNS